MRFRDIVDAALEAPVVPSFTRVGYHVRKRLDGWAPLGETDLDGSTILLTGGTSGLGRAAAEAFARSGATLVLVGRKAEKNQAVVDAIRSATGSTRVSQMPADLGDLAQVGELARQLAAEHDRLDVLVHNAGALTERRVEAPDGTESTVASQVVGPFLLTALLLDLLTSSAPSRVITMSSGGMYTAGLTVDDLEMAPDDYKGTGQYARAKRAQVTLNEMWAERFGSRGIHFHAMHPGWADTPGVQESLPTFSKVVGPLLRSPEQGADTLVWLASAPAALECNGGFWLDRRLRSIHKIRRTRVSDTPERREALWGWVVATAGVEPGDLD